MGAKAYHLTTGFKPRVIDPEYQEELGYKKAVQEQLRSKFRTGEIRRFERFYKPKIEPVDKDIALLLKAQ